MNSAPEPAATPAPFPYHPSLDGLRGLAVAAVLLFHAGHLRGGYLGVDAFFVLSGFLITSLLLAEHARTDRIDLGAFWVRRARRLLPALALVLLAVVVYAVVLARPDELSTIRGDGLATMFYVANWRQIVVHQDYWALFRSPSPLQHTWSLAIEEQFYLVWPVVAFFAVRRCDRTTAARRIGWLAVVGIAVSWALMQVWFDPNDTTRAYYGTDTRAASLFVGVALAAWLARGHLRSPSAGRALDGASIVVVAGLAVAWSVWGGSSAALYHGGLLACAIGVAVVIAACVHPSKGFVARAFAVAPLRRLGMISYGAYLWHWPVYVVLDEQRTGLTGWPLVFVRIAATLAVAIASYAIVEQPIRTRRSAARHAAFAAPIVGVAIVIALVASTAGAHVPETLSYLRNGVPTRGDAFWQRVLTEYRADAEHSTRRVFVFGDSVALSMGTFHDPSTNGASLGLIQCSLVEGALVADHVARVTDPRCRQWPVLLSDALDAYRPNTLVLMLGPWEMFDHEVRNDIWPAGSRVLTDALHRSLDTVHRLASARGIRLVIARSPCLAPTIDPFPGARATWLEHWRTDWLNRTWAGSTRRRPDTTLVPLDRVLCRGPSPRVGPSIRYDGIHFTPRGNDLVWKWLLHQPVITTGATPPG